jgi:hypothetical protein
MAVTDFHAGFLALRLGCLCSFETCGIEAFKEQRASSIVGGDFHGELTRLEVSMDLESFFLSLGLCFLMFLCL